MDPPVADEPAHQVYEYHNRIQSVVNISKFWKVHFEENTEENSEEGNDANVVQWIKSQVATEVVCPLKKLEIF